jgi:transcription elongation factor GreA
MSSQADIRRDGPVVRIGSRVRVLDEFGEEEFTIVPEFDADSQQARLSEATPMGRALIGRSPGERVRFRAPGGIMGVTLVDVR